MPELLKQKLIVCGTIRYAEYTFKEEMRRGYYLPHVPSKTLTHRTTGQRSCYASASQNTHRFSGARWEIIFTDDFYALSSAPDQRRWEDFKAYHDDKNFREGVKPFEYDNILQAYLALTIAETEKLLAYDYDLVERFRALKEMGPMTDISALNGAYGQKGLSDMDLDRRIYDKILKHIGPMVKGEKS